MAARSSRLRFLPPVAGCVLVTNNDGGGAPSLPYPMLGTCT